jgi:hypothetical protein
LFYVDPVGDAGLLVHSGHEDPETAEDVDHQ